MSAQRPASYVPKVVGDLLSLPSGPPGLLWLRASGCGIQLCGYGKAQLSQPSSGFPEKSQRLRLDFEARQGQACPTVKCRGTYSMCSPGLGAAEAARVEEG